MVQCPFGHFYDEVRFPSCPYCNPAPVGHTVAVAPSQPLNATVPLNKPESSREPGATVAVLKKELGIDPAVGFVVAITGAHKGQDFRLRSGRNFIGRGSAMDVSLPDDEAVSRENHALITYDNRHNTFMLTPGQSRGITYLNEAQIESAEPLHAYDVIEVGQSRLMFLPLCCEHFRWEDQ